MSFEWLERAILHHIRTKMSIKERLQLIQKIAELSVEELNMLEAEPPRESP